MGKMTRRDVLRLGCVSLAGSSVGGLALLAEKPSPSPAVADGNVLQLKVEVSAVNFGSRPPMHALTLAIHDNPTKPLSQLNFYDGRLVGFQFFRSRLDRDEIDQVLLANADVIEYDDWENTMDRLVSLIETA